MMILCSASHRFAGRYFDVRCIITVMLYYWEIEINDGMSTLIPTAKSIPLSRIFKGQSNIPYTDWLFDLHSRYWVPNPPVERQSTSSVDKPRSQN